MVGQHGFYARPSAHLLRLVTRAGLGRITRSSGIVRHGSVVKTFRWATMTESDSDDFGDMKELFASMANRPLVRVITPDSIAEQPDSELEVTMFDIVWGARGREPLQILDKLPDGFSVVYPTMALEAEVSNGGFNQFFYNPTRELYPLALTRRLGQRNVWHGGPNVGKGQTLGLKPVLRTVLK